MNIGDFVSRYVRAPYLEYAIILLTGLAVVGEFRFPEWEPILVGMSVLGALPVVSRMLAALMRREVTIDTFNSFAVIISFVMQEYRSAAFIVLMLAFASLLDHFTESRTSSAVEELLKLKPSKAERERGDGVIEEVPSDDIKKGDIVLVRSGGRIPIDGVVVFGETYVNEASVTGESEPVSKRAGDSVFSGTLNDASVIKIRATVVGKDSTLERMAVLIKEAEQNKSKPEKLADRFAKIFLPVVVVLGLATLFITGDPLMMAAIFVVACADDVAVAIPLAITATLGVAAKRGVIIKGGQWLFALAKIDTLVLDKTGTLTYGAFRLKELAIASGVDPISLWRYLGAAERYSEHPVGRSIFAEAQKHAEDIPESLSHEVVRGAGVLAVVEGKKIVVGNIRVFEHFGITLSGEVRTEYAMRKAEAGLTIAMITIDGVYAGVITVSDLPRADARTSIELLKRLGVAHIVMLTGDNEQVANAVAAQLGIDDVRANMTPESKLAVLDQLVKDGANVAMVGDGINDAPALARANVGIAMGGTGTAVAVEAANVIILTDELSRIAETIQIARRAVSVVSWDMGIWFATNVLGFVMVWVGLIGPALAALYNFATDFLPIANSGRLFRYRASQVAAHK